MSAAENHIEEGENADLWRDEVSLVPDAEQDENSDIDELYSYLTESSASVIDAPETEISMADETPFAEELADVSDGVSVLEELEAMYGSSDELVTDEDDTSTGDSVLTELEALLGSSVKSITDSVATGSRRSVLDELQELIQSSIDELKATANGNSRLSLLSAEWEYPTRDELKDLLESKLLQLIVDSDISISPDPADSTSVLDELSSLLDETGNDTDTLNTYISSHEEDVLPGDEYNETPEQGDETISPAESVTEDFENLLSGLTEEYAPEVLQDDLAISGHDEEVFKTDTVSVTEELEAYFGVSSDLENSEFQDLDTGYSAKEKKETDCISASSDSSSSALEHLETMLSETAGSDDGETSENIYPVDIDLIVQQVPFPLPASNEEGKVKDTAKLSDTVRPVEVKTGSQRQTPSIESSDFSAETENNKRLPKIGMLFFVVAVVGFIIIWEFTEKQDALNNNSQTIHDELTEEAVAFQTGKELLARTEAEAATPAEIDNIDDLLASIESSGYANKSLYDAELNDSYEKPVQSNVIGTLDNETITLNAEIEEPQIEQLDVTNEIESISQQVEYLQDKNKKIMGSLEESVDSLSERMIEAESSISRLQFALEKSEQSGAVQSVVSTVNDIDQINKKHEKSEKNIGLLNKRINDAESSISKLQQTIEQTEKLEPVQSVMSIASKMNAVHQSREPGSKLSDQTYNIWSVHLFSYYGKPPPARELEFLDTAGVPYQIEKVIVNDAVWYRVLVNNSSEYLAAKEYAHMLKKRLAIKKIWISKKQYIYD